jgi:alpha-1,3-mannosyl-glycoprotein beta-1,2-N-acetylglucosaminyltransferase
VNCQLFEEAGPLLDQDDTLMCVSSWNDNGYKGFDLDRKSLFRSGFFPGLGWMLRRQVRFYNYRDANSLVCDSGLNLKSHSCGKSMGFGFNLAPRISQLWQEWRGKWPKSHWDHWTRVDAQSMGRDCIVPEISRNHNIGSQGATVDSGSFAQVNSPQLSRVHSEPISGVLYSHGSCGR